MVMLRLTYRELEMIESELASSVNVGPKAGTQTAKEIEEIRKQLLRFILEHKTGTTFILQKER